MGPKRAPTIQPIATMELSTDHSTVVSPTSCCSTGSEGFEKLVHVRFFAFIISGFACSYIQHRIYNEIGMLVFMPKENVYSFAYQSEYEFQGNLLLQGTSLSLRSRLWMLYTTLVLPENNIFLGQSIANRQKGVQNNSILKLKINW